MNKSEIETIARVSVVDAHAPESNTVISLIGEISPPKDEDGGSKNGNGTYVVMAPSRKQEVQDIRDSLDRAKREVLRIRALEKATTFDNVFWILLLEQIRSATRARNASLYRVNADGDRLEPKVWFGDWDEDETPRSFTRGQGIAGRAWQEGKIYLSTGNVQEDPNFERSNNPRSERVQSILSVPVFNLPQQVIGVLNLDSYTRNRFSPRMKWRIEDLQRKAYPMLRQLKLNESMSEGEVISVFFWMIQKAVQPSYIVERAPAPPPERPAPAQVDPVYVNRVFSLIRDELSPGEGKPGPSPVRLDRLWSVFRGRENEPISLDDFESTFGDSADPRKSAASAVSWLNNIFKRWGYDLEIKTGHCTTYQLAPRAPSNH